MFEALAVALAATMNCHIEVARRALDKAHGSPQRAAQIIIEEQKVIASLRPVANCSPYVALKRGQDCYALSLEHGGEQGGVLLVPTDGDETATLVASALVMLERLNEFYEACKSAGLTKHPAVAGIAAEISAINSTEV